MELQRLVTGAKLGNNDDFGALVRLYQRRLLTTVRGVVRDEAAAEDLVQEAFVRAWSGLAGLKNAEAFPGWLWAIARNLARSQSRAHAHEHRHLDHGLEPDDYADPRSLVPQGEGADGAGWAAIAQVLGPDQRRLVELRHGLGLSLRQIGAVLGVPEQRVKSRLFTARQKLRKALGNLPPAPPVFLEEKIMDKIATLRLGAHVFERLSLDAQSRFALVVLRDQEFPEGLLADIGKVDRGAEFLGLYGTNLKLAEMVGFLNYVDRFTECRLVEHLEVVSPAEAERLKQNFFVFEDIVLFDRSALRLLYETADKDLLVLSLGGTELRCREHFLGALDTSERAGLEGRLAKADGDRKLVRAAQELVVHTIKDLEQSGRLVVRRKGDLADGELYLTAP